jgi:hypothetical protein
MVAGPRLSGLAGGVRRLDTSPRWSRCARDPAEVGGLDRYAHRRRSRPRGAGRCQLRVRCSSIPCLRSLPVVSVKGPRPRTPTPRAPASAAVCRAGASRYAPSVRRLPRRALKQLRPGVVCTDCASFHSPASSAHRESAVELGNPGGRRQHTSSHPHSCLLAKALTSNSCRRVSPRGLSAPPRRAPYASVHTRRVVEDRR